MQLVATVLESAAIYKAARALTSHTPRAIIKKQGRKETGIYIYGSRFWKTY